MHTKLLLKGSLLQLSLLLCDTTNCKSNVSNRKHATFNTYGRHSRKQTFALARGRNINLTGGTIHIIGKLIFSSIDILIMMEGSRMAEQGQFVLGIAH